MDKPSTRGQRQGPQLFVATESRHTLLGYGLRRRRSLMSGIRRRPRRKEIVMSLKGECGKDDSVMISLCASSKYSLLFF